jgi:hypothetical protein
MSVEAITWAFDLEIDDPIEKFVLVALANYADGYGLCWVSQARLVQRCSCSERKVRYAIRALEERGLILRFERRRDNGSRSSDGSLLVGFPGREIPRSREDHAEFSRLDVVAWEAVTTSTRHVVPGAATRHGVPPPPGTVCRSPRHGVPPQNHHRIHNIESFPPTPQNAGAETKPEENRNEQERGRKRRPETSDRRGTVAGIPRDAWAAAAARADQGGVQFKSPASGSGGDGGGGENG